ncbi:hypothetical protein VTN00DRAFT_7732 [Thermoascus crustaceus]|uniref:uncharacterized protein n=1 Tax=Thermoascus crustaceus TaxID=5088 RepID=UPI003743A92A
MATSHHDEAPFPWSLGVFDAHCHPTDTMTSIADIPHMKATTLTIMATRGEDQDLVHQVASSDLGRSDQDSNQAERVVPCFGWHPWFSHQIMDDITSPSGIQDHDPSSPEGKLAHYKRVLTPAKTKEDETFFLALPDPKPLSTLISETKARLTAHPHALVGEIGLDRAFRLPKIWLPHQLEGRDASLTPGSREGRTLSPYRVQMNHQKALFKAQLKLAGEMRRAVSVHSVQAHGAIFEVLQELWKGHERKVPSRRERKRRGSAAMAHAHESDAELDKKEDDERPSSSHSTFSTSSPSSPRDHEPLPFPPRICMHSYSGPVEPLNQFLRPTVPSDIYFSFSSVINFTNPSSEKVVEVIKALPGDRILIESDLHCAGRQMDDLLEEIARKVCELRGWELDEGVKRLAENWRRFVFG